MSPNPYLIMRPILVLLFLLALPLSVHAQNGLEGAWTLSFMMHEDAAQTLDVNAEVVQDTLHMTIQSDHGERTLKTASFGDEIVQFDLPTGHGSVTCLLYKKEDASFSGICEGPNGEIPTTMTRPGDGKSE